MPENPYQSPSAVSNTSSPGRWPYFGWLAPVITWMPAMLLVALGIPAFFEIFGQLQERGELPALASGLIAVARISQSLFHLPIAVLLTALIASDVAIADFAQRRNTLWLHNWWQTAICACGMIAVLLIVIGLLQPIIGIHGTV
jgi:hypothetical protein